MQKDISALRFIDQFQPIVVGVSGGADSMALAHFLRAEGYSIVIAHLNHGVRGRAADQDEVFVKKWASAQGVPFHSQKIAMAKGANFEDRARRVRYDFLEKVRQKTGAAWIAVAHHADDQVETILLHLLRGCDLTGAKGMSLQRDRIVRPFLNVTKAEILDYAQKNHLLYRDDGTNRDLCYRRNFMRLCVVPELKKEWPTLREDVLRFGEWAQKKDETIDRKALQWIRGNLIDSSFSRAAFVKLNADEQRAVLKNLVGPKDVYRSGLVAIQELILKGVTGKKRVLKKTVFEVVYGEVRMTRIGHATVISVGTRHAWSLRKLPLRARAGESIVWNGWRLHLKSVSPIPHVAVRPWQTGDRFQPAGMKGTKKVQDFFTDAKIPRSERVRIPIITDEQGVILAIGNLRLSERGKGFQLNLMLELNPLEKGG